jgi:acyl-CoA synthetase (AMP-forming)/AMP-acid ligase II
VTAYIDLINRGPRYFPNNIALEFGEQRMTFREAGSLINRLANSLLTLNIAPGTRVAILLNNSLYSVPVEYASAKVGISRVPLNARLSLVEHEKMLRQTGCELVICGADLSERAAELCARIPGLSSVGVGAELQQGDLLVMAESQSDEEPKVALEADAPMLTLFTSGTTGTLKAAVHTHATYAGICRNVLLNMISPSEEDAMLHAASLIHASGTFVLPFWIRGARTVILEGFNPATYLDSVTSAGITTINMVPTMLQMLLAEPGFAEADVSKLRKVFYGASPMPRTVIEQAMAHWGPERFHQYYGQTECPLCIAGLDGEDHKNPDLLGACGRPGVDIEIRLVDEDGQDVLPGKAGEIALRGPSMMQGYFEAPELNEQMFLPGGWLLTRDIGVFDERGYLHLKDRTSDMIITGGYNVYPREIEDVLLRFPDVAESAVIGIKHEKWVESVTAVVVPKPGCRIDEKALIDFVGEQVASYKKPHRVIVVDEIPKTAVGKLNRKVLRERYNS